MEENVFRIIPVTLKNHHLHLASIKRISPALGYHGVTSPCLITRRLLQHTISACASSSTFIYLITDFLQRGKCNVEVSLHCGTHSTIPHSYEPENISASPPPVRPPLTSHSAPPICATSQIGSKASTKENSPKKPAREVLGKFVSWWGKLGGKDDCRFTLWLLYQ